MTRRFFFFIVPLATAAMACDGASDRDRDPASLEVFAAPSGFRGFDDAAFAVGIRSELRVRGDLGMTERLRAVTCADDGCLVEPRPSIDGTGAVFFVTPKTHDFTVRVVVAMRGGDQTIERRVHAVDGDLIALHRGAGPGVPFVAGMHVIWYVGTKTPHVAWDAEQTTVSVTAPFELSSPLFAAEGPDGDDFVRVELHVPENLRARADGTVSIRNGSATTTFAVSAVPSADLAKLHVAPAPDVPLRENETEEPGLSTITSDSVIVPSNGYQRVWLVFETHDGVLGIAGAGECLPARDATFSLREWEPYFYGFELDDAARDVPLVDRPIIDLEAHVPGTSKLLLAAYDVTGSADVVVGSR